MPPCWASPDSSAASTRGRVTDAKSGIDQHARVQHAAGSSARFAPRSASRERSGRWRSYQGRWSRPTAWWWVIVPPASITRLRDGRLDLVPLLDLAAAPRRASTV